MDEPPAYTGFLYPGPSGGWYKQPACLSPLYPGLLSAQGPSVISSGPGSLADFLVFV